VNKNELTVTELATRYNVEKWIVLGWIERGLFPNARKEKSPFGVEFWSVPEDDLKNFEPQRRRGRPTAKNPSNATLAKRRQREQKKQIALQK
jgi:hypothetical protein